MAFIESSDRALKQTTSYSIIIIIIIIIIIKIYTAVDTSW